MADPESFGRLQECGGEHGLAVAGQSSGVLPVGAGDEELLREIADEADARASREHDRVARDQQTAGGPEATVVDAGEVNGARTDVGACVVAQCVVVEDLAEVAGRERGVQVELDTVG